MRPGGWKRLLGKELFRAPPVHAVAGWRIALPGGATCAAGVDHFLLFMDGAFPYSELRIVVPGMRGVEWPHVEAGELLCLEATSAGSSVIARVSQVLMDALTLLNWDASRCRAEFDRELQAYWFRSADSPIRLYALADPALGTRQAFYCAYSDGFLVADREEDARRWLRHDAHGVPGARMRRTLVIELTKPLLPSEYPRDGEALIELAGSDALQPFMALNRTLPMLLAFRGESGAGFVGLMIQSPGRRAAKGFRPGREPEKQRHAFDSMPAQLCRVERIDRTWAFGRGHGHEVEKVAGKRVAIIGCGALGGAIAMALAQAGVSRFLFVDGDALHAHNPARHTLGPRYLNWPKALAMATEIQRHAPTISEAIAFPSRFESLDAKSLDALSQCSLVICAGVDRRGEVHIDRWRGGLASPPTPMICTFSEEYALVGHAIALIGGSRLSARYQENGNFNFLATDWPKGSVQVREPGCGNEFQPFGIVDLMPVTQLASQLALDILLGAVKGSARRTWFADPQRVIQLGGAVNVHFTGSRSILESPWET
jgi:hypothetical protein